MKIGIDLQYMCKDTHYKDRYRNWRQHDVMVKRMYSRFGLPDENLAPLVVCALLSATILEKVGEMRLGPSDLQ